MDSESSLSADPFLEAGESIASHPFLQQAKKANLSHKTWATYVGNRLGAGSHFVSFLAALHQKASEDGYLDIATAVKGNLDDELGVYHGEIKLERTHEEWRRWFRDEMNILLAGHDFDTTFPEVSVYPQVLKELSGGGDVLEMTGALTGLEIIIAREYEQILAGLQMQFRKMISVIGYTYIHSHAIHDHGHYDDIYRPLVQACKSRSDIERALSGLQKIRGAKKSFLDGMERIRIAHSHS